MKTRLLAACALATLLAAAPFARALAQAAAPTPEAAKAFVSAAEADLAREGEYVNRAAWVQDTVEYVPGSTEVQTSAQEAWSQGQGVCQDIAHLTVALLREVGLPARYVSGYLHPAPEAELGDTVTGESHAWVEVWTGRWWAYDPTNDCPVGERHVAVGRGRDYGDVPPVKGIYAGNAENAMRVVVRMARVH